ncbi:DUF3253 domain-containing protein [Rhodovulum sp. 12E13]|uniref:DUF3253 domain-containing protein n=1 Tax=Rhodovulum sp. 12E13 TaxID=2203891 RepID=UPI000E18BD8D|nr:DUF3253 domain-containing protein [Rhodovulum sp. 12E13]RDC71159.1 DUF3253 domain-containing protein [Rhodovulum sp. 12E13]
MSASPDDDRIADILRDLARRRGPGKTFCPSEAARALADDWRPLMPGVRRVAGEMRRRGELRATRKGAPVDPETAAGPIRLGLPDA